MQHQQSSDLSSHSLVPRPSHRPVFVLLQYAYCELSKTGLQEDLGTRLTSQIPPKGVYSSVARESGYGRDPLVVGVALERLNLQVQLYNVYARIVITVIYLEILLLQSKQCLWCLNLTSEADDFVPFSALGAERGLQKRFRHATAQPERCNQLSAESVAKQ